MLRALRIGAVAFAAVLALQAQQYESESGFGLRGTFSGMAAASTEFQVAPRPSSGSPVDGGARLMLYPTWKLSDHWMFYGALQEVSRPYFYSQFETQGHGGGAVWRRGT